MKDKRCFTCKYSLDFGFEAPINCRECYNNSEWKEIKPKRLLDIKLELNEVLAQYLDEMLKSLSEESKRYIWMNYPNINDIEDLIEIGIYTREEAENKIFKRYIAEDFINDAMW